MTTQQFLVIVGTIYIAPHLPKWWSGLIGSITLIVAAAKGLEWI